MGSCGGNGPFDLGFGVEPSISSDLGDACPGAGGSGACGAWARGFRAPPPPGPEPAGEHELRPRSWVGAARSARTRILAAYGVFLIVAAVLVDRRAAPDPHHPRRGPGADALEQELRELDRLLVDGRDPATGAPFESLGALFDVYFARNVPSNDEALAAFVDGELYLSSVARFPLNRLPAESLADWEALSAPTPGEGESATGTFDTTLGTGYFRASRIRFGDDSGRLRRHDPAC